MSQTQVRCTGAHCNKLITWDDLNGRPHPYVAVKCKRCGGKGTVAQLQASFDAPASGVLACPRCHGKGTVLRSHFEDCVDAPKFRKKQA